MHTPYTTKPNRNFSPIYHDGTLLRTPANPYGTVYFIGRPSDEEIELVSLRLRLISLIGVWVSRAYMTERIELNGNVDILAMIIYNAYRGSKKLPPHSAEE